MQRFKINEISSQQFYMIPKELFTNARYKCLSNDSRILYSLLKDRMELSRKNNWINEEGEIYLIYTRDSISEVLNIDLKTVTKAFNLLKKCNLIEEIRQGQGKPNLIYIGHLELESIENTKTGKISVSRNVKFPYQETENFRVSNTYINNTDINKSVSQSQEEQKPKKTEGQTDGQTDIHNIIIHSGVDEFTKEVQELISDCVEDLYYTGVENYPLSLVRAKLHKLDRDIIQVTVLKFEYAQDADIKNQYKYFKKCLWNNIIEIGVPRVFNDFN